MPFRRFKRRRISRGRRNFGGARRSFSRRYSTSHFGGFSKIKQLKQVVNQGNGISSGWAAGVVGAAIAFAAAGLKAYRNPTFQRSAKVVRRLLSSIPGIGRTVGDLYRTYRSGDLYDDNPPVGLAALQFTQSPASVGHGWERLPSGTRLLADFGVTPKDHGIKIPRRDREFLSTFDPSKFPRGLHGVPKKLLEQSAYNQENQLISDSSAMRSQYRNAQNMFETNMANLATLSSPGPVRQSSLYPRKAQPTRIGSKPNPYIGTKTDL